MEILPLNYPCTARNICRYKNSVVSTCGNHAAFTKVYLYQANSSEVTTISLCSSTLFLILIPAIVFTSFRNIFSLTLFTL